MLQKIFYDNYLVAILKNKVTLTLNKPAYVRICMLDLTKVLLYKFHYNYIKKINMVTAHDYYLQTRIV